MFCRVLCRGAPHDVGHSGERVGRKEKEGRRDENTGVLNATVFGRLNLMNCLKSTLALRGNTDESRMLWDQRPPRFRLTELSRIPF